MLSSRSFRLLAPLAAAVVVTATAGAQRPDATLARAVAAYKGAESIAVTFDQTVTNPLTDRKMTSHGELVRKRPNLLSITFSSPATDRIVADGTTLWLYLPSSAPGQVMRLPASGQNGMLLDPLGQILSAPSDAYAVTDAGTASIGGRATHAITLTPRSTRALFTKATVWVDDADGLVRQVEATEPSGLVRRVTITQFRTNAPAPKSLFRFTPPPNVRVVDAASGSVTG
jgi:outer membrane lipoprotein carrier protein